jgi:hypothetical protein
MNQNNNLDAKLLCKCLYHVHTSNDTTGNGTRIDNPSNNGTPENMSNKYHKDDDSNPFYTYKDGILYDARNNKRLVRIIDAHRENNVYVYNPPIKDFKSRYFKNIKFYIPLIDRTELNKLTDEDKINILKNPTNFTGIIPQLYLYLRANYKSYDDKKDT